MLVSPLAWCQSQVRLTGTWVTGCEFAGCGNQSGAHRRREEEEEEEERASVSAWQRAWRGRHCMGNWGVVEAELEHFSVSSSKQSYAMRPR